MNKIAAITTALLILIPASAMFPLFARSADPPATTLFSRSYSNYTLDMGAPVTSTGNGDFKFILADYSVKYPTGLVIIFQRVGFAWFANDRFLSDGETSAAYSGTDVQFVIHRIPTGAFELAFSGANLVFFDLLEFRGNACFAEIFLREHVACDLRPLFGNFGAHRFKHHRAVGILHHHIDLFKGDAVVS